MLHVLFALEGTAEGTAVEFFRDGPPTHEFAREPAKKLVGRETKGEPGAPRGEVGLEDGAEKDGR